ncbi:Maf family protein [Alkalicoccobacillus porphyridii]|uniref:dTTP/UTP pyrophosphatase n=1 Tax=Alkalicoccobacillus porphyridii TaxID=2597270 RepID=A0A553ZXS3_9BACI|nr:Maf family protein [Alkalicoccobacillus porphyridii]TSB46234.1 septum formation inhibitor Maf [Alkalicoccobacillus porphyridii]
MKPLILASSSPRRKELLQQLRYQFTIRTSEADERLEPDWRPEDAVLHLSRKKAEAVFAMHPEAVVIGADTIVVVDDVIVGKPSNRQAAVTMLKHLSGRRHQVLTGVTIISARKTTSFYNQTDVQMYDLSDKEIDQYVESGEPFDKAGSYGIQGLGAMLVKQIHGDYYSVMGLPLAETARALQTFSITPLPS